MHEFDSSRDYTKTHYVLQVIEQGIQAQDLVDSLTITRYWQKGFKEVVEKDRQTKSLKLIQDIQVLASSVVRNSNTQI